MRVDSEQVFRWGDTVTTVALVVVAANLLTHFIAMPWIIDRNDSPDVAPQLIWWPALQIVWIQSAAIGLLLLFSDRTRPVGFGMLVGTLLAVALFVAWLWFVVAPNLY